MERWKMCGWEVQVEETESRCLRFFESILGQTTAPDQETERLLRLLHIMPLFQSG
jgi:hypothetical protein